MTEEAFASQFLMNPINPKSAVFRKEWIDQSLISPCPIEREKFRILMTVDPSVATSKRADYTGICVMGLDHTGRFWVFEAKKKKLRNEDLVAELQRIYKTWNPEAMVVEEVVFSELLKPLLTRSDKPLYEQIRYRGHKLDNKRSKAFRIKSTTPLLEFGCVNIFNNQTDLISEMRRYTGKDSDSDDVLDAFQIAVEELRPPDYKPVITTKEILDERKALEERDILDHLHPKDEQGFYNIFQVWGGQGGYR
jgi:predicted phage terminase large subunit-like protein